MTFDEIARARGFEPKLLYTVAEVSEVTGVPRKTLYDEIRADRLRATLPPGRRQGMFLRPRWVDEWIEEGAR